MAPFRLFPCSLEVLMRLPVTGLALLIPLAACATIMHGTSQGVGISSTPTAATVTVDNKPQGTTPLVANLSRKDNHVVRITMPGYQPYETTLTRGTSGWVWGNIVFGGIPGLIVDAVSGGLYKLTPEQITSTMTTAAITPTKDGFYIAVVMKPEAGWEKVGYLLPEVGAK